MTALSAKRPSLQRSVVIDGQEGTYSLGHLRGSMKFPGGYAVIKPILFKDTFDLTARVMVYEGGRTDPVAMTGPEFREFYRNKMTAGG